MRYVSSKSLSSALLQMYGSAGHLLKIWFTLKHMGLGPGRPPVSIDTANSTQSLRRLFGCGADDGRFYVPFAHTPRYLTMKHDASRSIIQTNIQRWATSGSVVTCDPTDYLDIEAEEDGKLVVRTGRQYPLGLGIGESGFALEEGARVRVPLVAFAVWYGRQLGIPDDVDVSEYLVRALVNDLHLSTAERALIFADVPLNIETVGKSLADAEIFSCCERLISGSKEPQFEIAHEDYPVYVRRVRGMMSNLALPSWMRTSPEEEVRSLMKDGSKAILLFGPPRTGKTRIVDSIVPRATPSRCTIQIHDGWGYDHLIEGFKPNSEGKWDWVDGPLKEAVEGGKNHIVLEEINRTQISQAMGEVFSLIEDTYRGEANGLVLRSGRRFWIPETCVFFLTMNTVDKSTEDIDDALMGRVWAVECSPRPEALQAMLEEKGVSEELRERLAQLFGEILAIYPLGHGYFAGLHGRMNPEEVVRYYKARIRPVLFNFLGELKRDDLKKVDNVVDDLFGVE